MVNSFIDFHKNFQLAPVDGIQCVVNIVIAPLAAPIPLFSHEFHSKVEAAQLKVKVYIRKKGKFHPIGEKQKNIIFLIQYPYLNVLLFGFSLLGHRF